MLWNQDNVQVKRVIYEIGVHSQDASSFLNDLPDDISEVSLSRPIGRISAILSVMRIVAFPNHVVSMFLRDLA